MFWKINKRENWGGEFERRVPLFIYLYDNVHKVGHGEMNNKKLKIEKNEITQEWQFCTP